MLRVDRNQFSLSRLQQRTLADVGLYERQDLQRMIVTSPKAFFEELGENLLLLAQEVRPADEVDDRIDLLALDEDGTVVVIELKRGNHKLHLLQALSYASMISKWEAKDLLNRISMFRNCSLAELNSDIDEFLLPGGSLNHAQRVILLAEDFDYSVLVTAEWLSERHDVDILCYRMTLAVDHTGEFLSCSRVYPPLELTAQVRLRRQPVQQVDTPRYDNWDEALNDLANQYVAAFFREAVASGLLGNMERRILHWPLNGRRRFWIRARSQFAYVWQIGRFDNDVNFWRERLGESADVDPVDRGTRLRFRLRTAEQCAAFRQATQGPLLQVQFRDIEQAPDGDRELEEGFV